MGCLRILTAIHCPKGLDVSHEAGKWAYLFRQGWPGLTPEPHRPLNGKPKDPETSSEHRHETMSPHYSPQRALPMQSPCAFTAPSAVGPLLGCAAQAQRSALAAPAASGRLLPGAAAGGGPPFPLRGWAGPVVEPGQRLWTPGGAAYGPRRW